MKWLIFKGMEYFLCLVSVFIVLGYLFLEDTLYAAISFGGVLGLLTSLVVIICCGVLYSGKIKGFLRKEMTSSFKKPSKVEMIFVAVLLIGNLYATYYSAHQSEAVRAHWCNVVSSHVGETEMVVLDELEKDKYGNFYMYDPVNDMLICSGKDSIFGTDDDVYQKDLLKELRTRS